MFKKLKLIIILCCTLQINQIAAQNLVPNPSFEDTIPCSQIDPYNPPRLGNLANWWGFTFPAFYSLLPVDSNSLCFYYTAPLPQSYAIVLDTIFYYQYPRTGNNIVGMVTSLLPSMRNIDILSARLNNTLQIGHKYCVEFYLNLNNISGVTLSTIGAYFTSDSLLLPSYDTTFNSLDDYITYFKSLYGTQPQIVNTPGNYITDTVGWQQISGEFIAQGNENFIAIGTIFNTWELDTVFFQTPINPGDASVFFYYIDDVSVTDCTVGIAETMQQEEVLLSPSLAQEYVTIEYKPLAGNPCRLEVFSSMGSKVMEQTLPKGSNKHRLTVSHLPPGVYYVRLQWAKQTAVGRFVKSAYR